MMRTSVVSKMSDHINFLPDKFFIFYQPVFTEYLNNTVLIDWKKSLKM